MGRRSKIDLIQTVDYTFECILSATVGKMYIHKKDYDLAKANPIRKKKLSIEIKLKKYSSTPDRYRIDPDVFINGEKYYYGHSPISIGSFGEDLSKSTSYELVKCVYDLIIDIHLQKSYGNILIKDFNIVDMKMRDYSNDKTNNRANIATDHRIDMDLYENN